MTMRSSLEFFLMPEKDLSLKIVFDNVRNYLICGALLSMVFWFKSGKAIAPPFIFKGPPKDEWQFLTWSTLAAFLILFALNAYQSLLISQRVFRFGNERHPNLGSDPIPNVKEIPWHVQCLILARSLALLAVIVPLVLGVAITAVYFSWFAAVGGRP